MVHGFKNVEPGCFLRSISPEEIINLEMVKSYLPFQVTESVKEQYSLTQSAK